MTLPKEIYWSGRVVCHTKIFFILGTQLLFPELIHARKVITIASAMIPQKESEIREVFHQST